MLNKKKIIYGVLVEVGFTVFIMAFAIIIAFANVMR